MWKVIPLSFISLLFIIIYLNLIISFVLLCKIILKEYFFLTIHEYIKSYYYYKLFASKIVKWFTNNYQLQKNRL